MKKKAFLAAIVGCMGMLMSCGGNENTCGKSDASEAVIENIMTRTSIRKFNDVPIAVDTLNLLVKAGMAAPTAMNQQPWDFIIVTEREMLDSLNSVKPWFNLKTATAAIVVCGNLKKTADGNENGYWVQDCSAATENILLAAHAYGLGAVWCGVYPNQEIVPDVTRLLQLPDSIIPLNVITMGHPADDPAPKDKFKQDNIHYQKW